MLLFHNDYNEACHSAVMEHMLKNQHLQMDGYGMDDCCRSAAGRISAGGSQMARAWRMVFSIAALERPAVKG